jgi:hypothetical protein
LNLLKIQFGHFPHEAGLNPNELAANLPIQTRSPPLLLPGFRRPQYHLYATKFPHHFLNMKIANLKLYTGLGCNYVHIHRRTLPKKSSCFLFGFDGGQGLTF